MFLAVSYFLVVDKVKTRGELRLHWIFALLGCFGHVKRSLINTKPPRYIRQRQKHNLVTHVKMFLF